MNVDAKFTTLKIGDQVPTSSTRDRGYLGFILDTKITRARIDFDSPINTEFAEAVAPIPTVGLAGRGYAGRNVAFGGEFTFFQIPGGEDRDFDGSVTSTTTSTGPQHSPTTPASPAAGGSWI